LVFSFM